MRFSAAVALAAAAAPLAVSAKARLGFALGVRHYTPGVPPAQNTKCKTKQDFIDDFNALKEHVGYGTKLVRTYAGIDGGANDLGGPECKVPGLILPAAKETGFQVVLGIWADTENSYEADKQETLYWAKQYPDQVYAFTVGSEGLYRNEQKPGTGYTAKYILSKINDFKSQLSNTKLSGKKVGTADSWNKFQDKTADPLVEGGVNLLLVNAFGYWQSQAITNASHTYFDDLQQAIGRIQYLAKSSTSIEIWNGETGWPTDGGSNYHDSKYSPDTAIAGTANAQTFFKEGVCAALKWNQDVFYFEAFNEPWKPSSKGLNGREGDETHWGAFNAERQPVIRDFSCSYP